MRYHGDHHVLPLLAPEGGHPTWEDTFIKNTKMQGPFFLATPVNVINISSDMLFQKVQQIYTRLVNMNLLLTKYETLFNINIVPSFHPPFEPINNLFTVTGLWPGETVNALKLFLSRTWWHLQKYQIVLFWLLLDFVLITKAILECYLKTST